MGGKKRQDEFYPISKDFGDDFVNDIAEGYKPEFVMGVNGFSFGNQGKESEV